MLNGIKLPLRAKLSGSLIQYFVYSLVVVLMTGGSAIAQAELTPPAAKTKAHCQFTQAAIAKKEKLRQAYLSGEANAKLRYQTLLEKHADILSRCRSQTWPQNQAIWLRLYPCDARSGAVDRILDRIVNQGYNKVYVETFYDGRVLLPAADNATAWKSVVRSPGKENVDLLARVIEKGHERGLEVYAWMYTLNFGYSYAQRPEGQQVLARNGRGKSSLSFGNHSQAFIDPYSRKARQDYSQLVQAVVQRQPDGVLFDYIRYPRGTGSQSVVNEVQDLWIYGDAAREELSERAQNRKGRSLIEKFLRQGYITTSNVEAINQLPPEEEPPLWEGRNSSPTVEAATKALPQDKLQSQLWYLSVAHAAQGILDFLSQAKLPVENQGISAGAVFFPDANQVVGQGGFDSRLQPWERFPASLEWHPMSYAVCGSTNCIVDQVERAVDKAPSRTKVIPALAGVWGKPRGNRPSLEAQMQAIQQEVPLVDSVSHFAYSWQNPRSDRDRKSCNLN